MRYAPDAGVPVSAKFLITLIEPHRVKSVWRRGSQADIIGTVRRNTPLHSQPIVAALLRRGLGADYAIAILDCRLALPDAEELYKVVPYGDGVLEHYRVGLSLDSERFRDAVRSSNLIGVTVNFTQEADVAGEIGRRARALIPAVKLVYAGADVRARPDHYLGRVGADAVVLGDGERCGPDLVSRLVTGRSLEGLPSVAYRDGSITRSAPAPPVPIDEVPLPAFDLVAADIPLWVESHEGDLPAGVEPPLAYVETSRGCHETCAFCYSAGIKYRPMLDAQIAAYADHLRASGFRTLLLIADNELTPLLMSRVHGTGDSGRELIINRFRALRARGFRWEFSNGLQYSMFRHNGRIDDELIEAMFDGCYRLFTPIEDPLDLPYDKQYGTPAERRTSGASKEQVFQNHHLEVLARIAASGLGMMTFGFMVGWPGDTVERVRRVGERCRRLRDAVHQANPGCAALFTPFVGIPIPGTRNWQDFQRRGVIKEDVCTHPEAWQFALTTFGNHEMVDARLRLIAELDGEEALHEWTSTGVYPHQHA